MKVIVVVSSTEKSSLIALWPLAPGLGSLAEADSIASCLSCWGEMKPSAAADWSEREAADRATRTTRRSSKIRRHRVEHLLLP